MFQLVVSVLVTIAVGRVALSWLPPGRPGYHELRELPLTLATSHLLGRVVWTYTSGVFWTYAHGVVSEGTGFVLSLLPWIALAWLRWATLPGALVPRHEARGEDASPLARSLFVLALAIASVPLFARGEHAELLSTTTPALLALVVIAADALAGARRLALGRAGFALALAAYCVWQVMLPRDELWNVITLVGTVDGAVYLAAGAAFAIRFVRHADRRAGMLALIFLAGRTTDGLDPIALASVAALLVAVPAPLRQRTAIAAVVVLVLAYLPSLLSVRTYGFQGIRLNLATLRGERRELVLDATLAFASIVGGFALVARGLRRAREGRETRPSIDVPRREERFFVVLLVLGLAGTAYSRVSPWSAERVALEPFHPALMPLVPVALLWLGLLALGPEKARAA